MNVAGIFAGVGGFELGLEKAGHTATLLCEVLPVAQAVLRSRFADVELKSDVLMLRSLPASTEVLTAGFPCQDLSQAGRTAGIAGDRSGLVAEVFRLLKGRVSRGRRVPWVVLENVPFMLHLAGGQAMRSIVDEFERLGYRWAYRIVDSNGFGLAHRRKRVYLVASAADDPSDVLLADDAPFHRPETCLDRFAHGFYWTEGFGGIGWAVDAVPTLKNGSTIGIPSPPAILLPGGGVVKPGIRTAEVLQGFPPGWTQPAEEVARPSSRWSLVGSAVSVPVSRWIGERLDAPGRYDRGRDRPFPTSGKAPRAARFDGTARFEVAIGLDPLGIRSRPLVEVMGDDHVPLSPRATAGFLGRAERASLNFADGFLEAVRHHLHVDRGAAKPGPAGGRSTRAMGHA